MVEDGVETLYTANALNQYTRVGDATFTYDSSGNMTARADGTSRTTYTYDLNNRLSSVTQADGTVLSFEYDVFGNRVAKTVAGARTEYLVDPFGLGNVVSEFTGGSLSATYAHGLGLAAAEIGGADAFYDADAVGTVTTLTGARGAVQNRYVFTPFGREVSEVEGLANSFEFNGILGVAEDADGLTFMRARSYSDELGRFTSEDPLWRSGDSANLNRFAYNNPVALNDPSGELAAAAAFAAGAAGCFFVGQAIMERMNEAEKLDKLAKRLDEAGANSSDANSLEGRSEMVELFVVKIAPTVITGAAITRVGLAAPGAMGCVTGLGLGFLLTPSSAAAEDALKGATSDPAAESGGSTSLSPAKSGGSDGDPHIRTFDGLGYSFQATGEFTLFRTKDGSSEFQVRQEPWQSSTTVSVNTAVTARLGDATVGVYAGQATPLLINGKAVTLAAGQSIAAGTGSVYFNGSAYTITDESGNGVWARARSSFINLRPFINNDSRGQVEGLLGNADGNRLNDFTLRDGTVLSQPLPETQLYGEFADAWRIDQSDSLFVYGEGESTETFTNRDFPSTVVKLDDLDPVVRANAEATATAAGLVPGTFEFATTVLDIALTGVEEFAELVADAPAFQPEGQQTAIVPVEVNEAPTANPDSAQVAQGGAVTIDVLANDTDPDGEALSLAGGADPNGGDVTVVDAKLRFTPAPGFNGETTLSYELNDTGGNAVTGAVTVTVTAAGDLVGTSGNDDLTTRPGGDRVLLIDGNDILRGALDDFYGDVVSAFGVGDTLIFEGAHIARGRIAATQGPAVLSIDSNGDGRANGQLTLAGDFSGGDFMALIEGADTHVTFAPFLPALRERQAVDPTLVNGIVNQNFLRGDGASDFKVTLRDMGFAGYNNALGAYEIDASGNIIEARLLFENANADKSAVARVTDVEAGHRVGFFIVQNAADWAGALADSDTLSFVNDSGAAANISDGGNISIAVNGAATDKVVFHSFSSNMNSDGLQHALSGVDPGGQSISVGFEDLTGGGDRDYEDVVFRVEIVDAFMLI